MVNSTVTVSPELVMAQFNALKQENYALQKENSKLKSDLKFETELRIRTEIELENLKNEIENKNKKRGKKEKVQEYTPVKINGVKKATKADNIRSYNDFKIIQGYMLDKVKTARNRDKSAWMRNYALWTCGCAFGLRCGDLLKFKFSYVLNDNLTFRDKVFVNESKTKKLQHCIITEVVQKTLTEYFEFLNWNFNFNDYIFSNFRSENDCLTVNQVWDIYNKIGKELDLPFHFSTHTMRKSFANIAITIDKSNLDPYLIVKCQGLLNHSNSTTTMRYMGALQQMYDKSRRTVSDFLLGKTDKKELTLDSECSEHSIDEIWELLNEIIGN